MKALLEVILPVSDPDRSLQFRSELAGRGVAVTKIRHKNTDGGWRGGFLPDLDPDRAYYASFADFRDPDGNAWVLPERNHQPT